MKKIISLILALIMIVGCMSVSAAASYGESVERVKALQLLNTEAPEQPLTRGEGIYALMRLNVRSVLPQTTEKSVFYDVAQDSPYLPYTNYAYNLGFINGMGDGRLCPDETMNINQFLKIAVSVLGYKTVAESDGGYPEGYLAVATKLGLMKGYTSTDKNLSHRDAVILIDNMLDLKALEPIWGKEGGLRYADETVYQQMMNAGDISVVSGLVTAIGEATLKGAAPLEKGEMSVGSVVLNYTDAYVNSLLGRWVVVHYAEKEGSALPVVVTVYTNEYRNKEMTVSAEDIENLSFAECVYMRKNESRKRLRFENLQVFYNGRLYDSEKMIKPETGIVTALDNDNNGSYDILFVEEYRSFIVDKVLTATDTVYLQDGYDFRGKKGIRFDFEDEDKSYEIVNEKGENIAIEDIMPGDVVSVWADMGENVIRMQVSSSQVVGALKEMDDESVAVNGKTYTVYSPNRTVFMTKYSLGQSGKFGLNHADEIVGVIGEIESDVNYGFVIDFVPANGMRDAGVKLLVAGTRERESEIVAKTEIITYNYTNGGELIYEFEKKIRLYNSEWEYIDRVSSSSLTEEEMNRAVVGYELSSDGKIKSLSITSVPTYESASQDVSYSYKLNGDLNSFGGFRTNPAFYVGDSTDVICVPKSDNPTVDDYNVSVPVVDGSQYIVMPVRIDADTQIAGCTVIIADMDATEMSLFSSDDEVSVLGNYRVVFDEDGNEMYRLDILTGDEFETVIVDPFTVQGSVAANMKRGDLIRYDSNKSGKVKNIAYLYSLTDLGRSYFINNENTQRETVFGRVTSIDYDRLDNYRNERVDKITVDINGSERVYVVARKDGPKIYTLDRSSGVVSPAVPEEILASDQVGTGSASDVFMMVSENEPVVVVNVVE